MGIVTPLLTSKKVLEITYPTPYENLQGTPTSLPTSEPTDPQISYTVAEADLPTLNMNVESKIIVALMYAGGKNTDSASQTLYWKMLKNGSEIKSGSKSISANYYWTLNAFFCNVAIGDTLAIKLWATSTNVNWDYEARQLQFSRIALLEKYYVLILFKVLKLEKHPQLSQGANPYAATTQCLFYHSAGISKGVSSGPEDFSPWKPHSTYKLFRIYRGDYYGANSGNILTHSSYQPYYYSNYVPKKMELRALRRLT